MLDISQLSDNGFKAVDLFCGAGIGAYGFKKAGYDLLYAVDNDKDAVETYNINIGNHAVVADIHSITADMIPEHDLMIATPVCKPFSVCGARRLTSDELYGDLLLETVRLFKECRPKAFFFENVAGIAMGDSLPIFKDFVLSLESYGYHAYWSLVNSWDLGVPQERVRMYMVLIRDDIPYEFIVPKALVVNKTTQKDAIYDLRDKTEDDVPNHNTARLSKSIYSSFSANFRQSSWDSPSKTVLSSMQSALLYPEPLLKCENYKEAHDQMLVDDNFPRRMSVREHLRLQTVGDDFYFPSHIKLKEQYNRCSGVPSLIAYKYGKAIADCLSGKTPLRQTTVKLTKPLF